jgi:hypothetical protein
MNKGEDADPPGKHNCRWPIPAAPLIKTLRCWRIHSPLAKACMVGLAKSAASAGGFDRPQVAITIGLEWRLPPACASGRRIDQRRCQNPRRPPRDDLPRHRGIDALPVFCSSAHRPQKHGRVDLPGRVQHQSWLRISRPVRSGLRHQEQKSGDDAQASSATTIIWAAALRLPRHEIRILHPNARSLHHATID